MIAGIVAVIAVAHDAERRGYGAWAGGQYRADQQHLDFDPGSALEPRCQGSENGSNGLRQGKHGWALLWKSGQASLPRFYNVPNFCTKHHYVRVAGRAEETN